MLTKQKSDRDLEQAHKAFLLEMSKLQIQQQQILADYARKVNELKLKKIRAKL
ncbi:MAG: hypothetical protein Q8P32_02905 [Candidatus Komeilibacteria bacterium]|nr:hypothetical protein [Candidatus Komeilibacteria bacterium]